MTTRTTTRANHYYGGISEPSRVLGLAFGLFEPCPSSPQDDSPQGQLATTAEPCFKQRFMVYQVEPMMTANPRWIPVRVVYHVMLDLWNPTT